VYIYLDNIHYFLDSHWSHTSVLQVWSYFTSSSDLVLLFFFVFFSDSSLAAFSLLNCNYSTIILASLDWTCSSRNAFFFSLFNTIVSKVVLSLLLLLISIWSFSTCSQLLLSVDPFSFNWLFYNLWRSSLKVWCPRNSSQSQISPSCILFTCARVPQTFKLFYDQN